MIPTTTKHIEEALSRTRLGRKLRNAVRLVLVDKLTVAEAGRRVRRHRNNVYRALKIAKRKITQVKRETL